MSLHTKLARQVANVNDTRAELELLAKHKATGALVTQVQNKLRRQEAAVQLTEEEIRIHDLIQKQTPKK